MNKKKSFLKEFHNLFLPKFIAKLILMPNKLQVLIILFFAALSSLNAQVNNCSIKVDITSGCAPQPVKFNPVVQDTSFVKSYFWDFGDGTNSTLKDASHIYSTSGKYVVTLIVYYKDGSYCQIQHPTPIRIFSRPTANFAPTEGDIIVCSVGEKICFKDLSKPGKENSPVSQWIWTFGDGGFSRDKNPCYSYAKEGSYTVTLEVTDSSGCRSSIIKKTFTVKMAADIGAEMKPKFKVDINYNCATNNYTLVFHNISDDTTGTGLKSFIWDYDDGTRDSCGFDIPACTQQWQTTSHTYTTAGTFKPKLIVYNKWGCSKSFELDTALTNIEYKFSYDIYPKKLCLGSISEAVFTTAYHPYGTFEWDVNGDSTFDLFGPMVVQDYRKAFGSGTYNIRLRVTIGGCVKDTILCKEIKVAEVVAKIGYQNGPSAVIPAHPGTLITDPKGEPTPKYGNTWIIPKSIYPDYFNSSCYGKDTYYFVYDTTVIPYGDTTYTYCGMPKIDSTKIDSIISCDWKMTYDYYPAYDSQVVEVKDLVKINATKHSWSLGSPYPPEPVYSNPPFFDNPLRLNDTDFVANECRAPKLIHFTNFSGKNRGYFAYDNDPINDPWDTCFNPSFPYASDSLQFTWRFEEGNGKMSTTYINEDIRSSSSNLKRPTHLFLKDGCYWVKLNVYDSISGCGDVDSIPIVLQGADAGWGPEYDTVEHMTWLLQKKLPKSNPRRGFILEGKPCINDSQGVIMSETLPSCYKPIWAVVFDSTDNKKDDCDTSKRIYNWEQKTQFKYPDSGWYTIGFAVKNNDNCYDTVWYHNYKYFHEVNASVNTNKVSFCIGDTITVEPAAAEQTGIKMFTVEYFITETKFDTLEKFADTFKYDVLTIHGVTDTITTTVHNWAWGKHDSAYDFNNLYDTLAHALNTSGHITIKSKVYNRFGCVDSSYFEGTIGHSADLLPSSSILCAGDSVQFFEAVNYYLPYGSGADYDFTPYWQDPIGERNGRIPALPETLSWDMNGDSIIDITGSQPKWKYDTPGVYTVQLYTTDSNGCKQVLRKENFIKVIMPIAKFVVDSPGADRFCAPHFYHFIDSSQLFPAGASSIVSWTWDFGDGSPPLEITDPSKRSPLHLYEKNGEYIVTLKIKTPENTGADKLGCTDSFSMKISIKGPQPEFEKIGDTEGCAPFTLKLIDKTKSAAAKEFYLGDGTVYKSEGQDTIELVFTKPGTYCPYLIAVDTLLTAQGDTLYCLDTFPKTPCDIKVIVHALNEINVKANDTILCAGIDRLDLQFSPDTGYSAWTADFGDGRVKTSPLAGLSHIYQDTGKYKIKITGENGRCPDTAYLNVRVVDVWADFEIDEMNIDTPFFNFINTSENAVRYIWSVSDGSPDVEQIGGTSYLHEFKKIGVHDICLTAYNPEGCSSKVCKTIEIVKYLFIPNVFTPDNDPGLFNEKFRIDILGESAYHLRIFNRWGELVFESEDKMNVWDGTSQKSGVKYPSGTYYLVFNYSFIGGPEETYHGTVTLLR